jgi:hypothetical protein
MAETDVGAGDFAQFLFEEAHQLPLLALHAIRVIGVAGKQRQIEGRDRAGLAVAELPSRGFEAGRDHSRHDGELVEQIERRRMEGRAAQLHDQFGLGREESSRDATACQSERRGQANWARADNYDAIFFVCHRPTLLATRIL